jgi:hypothetical protein
MPSPGWRMASMERKELLTHLSFGTQVAEDERKELARYFVETDQWRRISNDEIDVIRGEKGSGKSAIYALLLEKESEFFDKRILITPGENPRGETVFRDLVTEPPATEAEFILLWKLYIVSIIAREMRTYNINGKEASSVYHVLENEHLLETQSNLAAILRRVQQTAKRLIRSLTIEGSIAIDPPTGLPLAAGKISLKEPVGEEKDEGFLSLDSLFSLLSKALKDENFAVWVLLDRLDVAFIDNHALEANALRALIESI